MATIMDGKLVSQHVKDEIKAQVEAAVGTGKRPPCLAVILVGDDEASKIYVRNKKRACEATGIRSLEFLLDASTPERELLALIARLNADPEVDGILVQMPVPPQISADRVVDAISPEKDVDCFHAVNVGRLSLGAPVFLPCTPAGVMRILSEYGIDVSGKECVVVGRSNIVGKPMAQLLLAQNGTVTICHSRTKDLAAVTRRADILIAAVGKARLIGADMIKEGAVIVDVGMNRPASGLCGDVDFDACAEKASYITPVPGGVGPMTIAMLLQNTLTSYQRRMQR